MASQHDTGYHTLLWFVTLTLLARAARTGTLYRGLLPGLIRSSVANGTSMSVYKFVHAELSRLAGVEQHSNI